MVESLATRASLLNICLARVMCYASDLGNCVLVLKIHFIACHPRKFSFSLHHKLIACQNRNLHVNCQPLKSLLFFCNKNDSLNAEVALHFPHSSKNVLVKSTFSSKIQKDRTTNRSAIDQILLQFSRCAFFGVDSPPTSLLNLE